ncbi:MAG: cytochrome C [Gemmatimonadales bacterium]
MRPSRWFLPALILGLASPASATDIPKNLEDLARAYVAAHTGASSGHAVPGFARQTGLACSACHYQFLALTPFGRQFKLNGYTLTNQTVISEQDPSNGGRLGLSPLSMLSAMLTASVTQTKDGLPDSQNGAAEFPQELSAFLAGRISSNMGLFAQFTYAGADGAFGIDNVDVRFAGKTTLGSTDMAYGLTLNNNPGVQDLWNTLPAWGYPFTGSEVAPGGAAAVMLDGGLAQNVLGAGAYALLGNLVYGELTVYRSAFQGAAAPSSATGAIKGVAPYWRLALQRQFGDQYLMVGTFGMRTSMFPDMLSGPRDTYTDAGVDAQFESKAGSGNVVVRGSWTHESQKLDATFANGGSDSPKNTLKTLRANASWYPRQWLGLTGGYFTTTGSTDAGLYAPADVEGSANGSPKTNGFMGELDLNPWENTRVGLQYTNYSNFNGGKTNYDGMGRNASGNNTLFAFVWLAF